MQKRLPSGTWARQFRHSMPHPIFLHEAGTAPWLPVIEKAFARVLPTAAKNLLSPAKARRVTGAVAVRDASEL